MPMTIYSATSVRGIARAASIILSLIDYVSIDRRRRMILEAGALSMPRILILYALATGLYI